MSTGERTAGGTLIGRYDTDEAFRTRLAAMYRANRSGFISSLLTLAYEHGASRPEAVEFANAITRRVRTGS